MARGWATSTACGDVPEWLCAYPQCDGNEKLGLPQRCRTVFPGPSNSVFDHKTHPKVAAVCWTVEISALVKPRRIFQAFGGGGAERISVVLQRSSYFCVLNMSVCVSISISIYLYVCATSSVAHPNWVCAR